ncbi:GNAT family N-acetyltransferase [Rathayibacter sp. YIM 133350]|uniref:GNAT family N-acetyltransferase n=1 Tax=Rathayibacter sp. YIM 133350 TaxID=3131992 RepID=UPI00307D86F9
MSPVDLHTTRLLLDQPTAGDIDAITAFCQDPLFERYLTTPWPYDRSNAEGFVTQVVPAGWRAEREFTWAVRAEGGGPLLGMMSLRSEHADVGFWMGAPHRGTGYTSEALEAIVHWAFEARSLPRVLWECYVGNLASAGTARRAGFAYMGTGTGLVIGRDGERRTCWQGEITPQTDAALARASWPPETRA